LPGIYYVIYDEDAKKYTIIRNDGIADPETSPEKILEVIREN